MDGATVRRSKPAELRRYKVGDRIYAVYRCRCGREFGARPGHVAAGAIRSCGCLLRQMRARQFREIERDQRKGPAERGGQGEAGACTKTGRPARVCGRRPQMSHRGVALRIECVGYGRPCPNHSWWYHDRPGRPQKCCATCNGRRRWLEPEHATTCVSCGEALTQPATGRPRLRCQRCSPSTRPAEPRAVSGEGE
jgi:hypothetical protein